MIQFLKTVTELVQDWLPLTYKRTPKEMSKRLILEYFQWEEYCIESDMITEAFGENRYAHQITEKSCQNLLLWVLNTHSNVFLDKNRELALESLRTTKNEWKSNREITIEKLAEMWNFMKSIVEQVQNGDKKAMEWYIELKKIEKWCKNYISMISDEAFSDFDNWDKNSLPYWYTWSISSKLNAKYDQDEEYLEIKSKLKAREALLKNAIEQDVKWMSINDSDWMVVKCPEYKYTWSLTVRAWVKDTF